MEDFPFAIIVSDSHAPELFALNPITMTNYLLAKQEARISFMGTMGFHPST
jgi:hypothetical protein